MQKPQQGISMKVSLLAAALFVVAFSVSPVVFAQVNSYTVTDLGSLSTGGNVTGNQYVLNWFEVPYITTTKIRVLVNNGLASHSRIVEVEAWNGWHFTHNIALASKGSTATASSTLNSNFLPVAAINGDRKGIHFGSDPSTGSAWHDGTADSFPPDWLQIDFSGSKTLERILVYTLQDDYLNPVEPSHELKFTLYGMTAFQVQYWNGSAWVDIPNIARSRAWKINNSGVVVGDSGNSFGPNNASPFKWENGLMTGLGGFTGVPWRYPEGSAYSINSAGVIAGRSQATTGMMNPFRWTAGTFLNLGLVGTTWTDAYDINDAATVQIAGSGETNPNTLANRGYVWSSPTGKVLIPFLPGGTTNDGFGINNLGHVVGHGNLANFEQHAYRKVGLTVTDLGTLGGTWSTARDINDAGLIVGASRIAGSPSAMHAFSYANVGGMVDLGTLGGGIYSWAYGVNNAGVIVGNAYTSSWAAKAFVYDSINGMRDLNTLTSGSGWTLTGASSINGGGQIVGTGNNTAGIQRAFLLTPNLNGAPSNQALASNGATAVASSTFSLGNTANATINGDRKGVNWGTSPLTGSGWQCATANTWGDTLQVTFAGKRIISEINVITAQTDVFNPVEPTLSTTFTANGITAYQVQYWDGVNWVNAPGGNVTGNNFVWRKFTFSPLVTDKIRVLVNNGNTHSRIVELEAWGTL